MSLPYAPIGAGMLVLPPLARVLLSVYDWRIAHRLIGGGVMATLPLVMLLPLGRMTAGSNAWRLRHATAATGIFAAWSLSVALRTSAFWGLFTTYLFTALAAYSVIPHCVAYLVEHGFDALLAASAYDLAGMLSAIGIVAMGWLSDRIGRRQAATISYISTLSGIAALTAISVWPSQLLLYAFVILFGLMQGARGPIVVAMVAALFSGRVRAIHGALSLAQGFGAALGSWLSGMLYELTGSYLTSFTVAACGALAGLASFWVVAAFREESIGAPDRSLQDVPKPASELVRKEDR
jgi:predicted MFS family arabinose efflux permease